MWFFFNTVQDNLDVTVFTQIQDQGFCPFNMGGGARLLSWIGVQGVCRGGEVIAVALALAVTQALGGIEVATMAAIATSALLFLYPTAHHHLPSIMALAFSWNRAHGGSSSH